MKSNPRGKPLGRTAKAWRSAKVSAQEHAEAIPRRKMQRKQVRPFLPPGKPVTHS